MYRHVWIKSYRRLGIENHEDDIDSYMILILVIETLLDQRAYDHFSSLIIHILPLISLSLCTSQPVP